MAQPPSLNRNKIRVVTLSIGALLLVGAVIVAVLGLPGRVPIVMALSGAVVIGLVLGERAGYLPQPHGDSIHWQATGERFRDPTSGKLMEVHYDPATGQRDYREASPAERPDSTG